MVGNKFRDYSMEHTSADNETGTMHITKERQIEAQRRSSILAPFLSSVKPEADPQDL